MIRFFRTGFGFRKYRSKTISLLTDSTADPLIDSTGSVMYSYLS